MSYTCSSRERERDQTLTDVAIEPKTATLLLSEPRNNSIKAAVYSFALIVCERNGECI